MSDDDHRPHLAGVIGDLCHQLGVDPKDVLGIRIGPGTVDVVMRSNNKSQDGRLEVDRRLFTWDPLYDYPIGDK